MGVSHIALAAKDLELLRAEWTPVSPARPRIEVHRAGAPN